MDSTINDFSKVIITTQNGIKEFKTIFFWIDDRKEQAHCLARLFLWEDNCKGLFILSELKSNSKARGITGSFEELSAALISFFEGYLASFQGKIEWYVHHGGFSVHDGGGFKAGISLREINPNIIRQFDAIRLPKTELVSKKTKQEKLNNIELDIMRPILKELNWELENWLSDSKWE
jgi:hypothetical protein